MNIYEPDFEQLSDDDQHQPRGRRGRRQAANAHYAAEAGRKQPHHDSTSNGKGKRVYDKCPYCNSPHHRNTGNCYNRVFDMIHQQLGAHATADYIRHQTKCGRKVHKRSSRTVPLPEKTLIGITHEEREKALKSGKMPRITNFMSLVEHKDESSGEEDANNPTTPRGAEQANAATTKSRQRKAPRRSSPPALKTVVWGDSDSESESDTSGTSYTSDSDEGSGDEQ